MRATDFCINTYSYTLTHSASACIQSIAERGYKGVELMMYPGHLWPTEMDLPARRALRSASDESGLKITSINMPNIDINVTGASQEMRRYTLGLLSSFIDLGGDLEVPYIIVGPGKTNPLMPLGKGDLIDLLKEGLDRLCPIAERAGTRILLENMPFSFLPKAVDLIDFLQDYGNPDIGVIYDVANGHFIGEDPCAELMLLRERLKLVHFSDTERSSYKHDAVGMGSVPFAEVMSVLDEIGYAELPVLEIISQDSGADASIDESARRLAALAGRVNS